MMKQYAVKVTDEALEDMRALRDYIENELLSPGNAERQYRRIAEKILKLKSFPAARGRKEPCTAFLYAINVIQSIYLL